MKRTIFIALLVVLASASLTNRAASQDLTQRQIWAIDLASTYSIRPDVVYMKANNVDLKLDLYLPRDAEERGSVPTVMYIHGGGWVFGRKEGADLHLLPYLAKGWAAVNVGYRLSNVSHAPAAVEDVRCALRWVIERADELNVDPDKIVVTGHSAGGHLALSVGLIPSDAGLDLACPGNGDPLSVAAVINWYGITDVADLLEGTNQKTYAVAWLGSQGNRKDVAERVSPIHYVSEHSPPVLTIHGDADDVVPYSHAVRLHQVLEEEGVSNRLVTIEDGGHGDFNRDALMRAFSVIDRFLAEHVADELVRRQ